jgi:4-diphosphocytidyl-2C-methyl-D-erythritol kinase
MPELASLSSEISAQPGVDAALLCGSGSTIFGICESADAAARAARHFSQRGYWTKACSTR